MREPIEREIGKIGRAVLAIALTLATAMLVLAVVALVDLAMQPQLEGPPPQDPVGRRLVRHRGGPARPRTY